MDEAWRQLYPFADQWLTLDGQRYHYIDEGEGEPLLLVHGNPTWSFYWRNLILGLRGRYRLIAVDHIGCGLSGKPRGYSYRLAQHVANLRRLIEHLDLRNITLVAHDWGGAIGLGAAVAEPSRFARLVLMNTAAFRSKRMPLRIRLCRTPVLGRIAVQGFNAFARAALRMAVHDRARITMVVRSGYLAPYDCWARRQAIYEFVQDIPMTPNARSYKTLVAIEDDLRELSHLPTMLIWGMRDWCFTSDFLERFREFFPAAEVIRFEDAGHYVVEDAQERIVPALADFLERHPLVEVKRGEKSHSGQTAQAGA